MSNKITGQVLGGRYKITGYLREGRIGNMYVARRLEDNAMFSVKLLDAALNDNEEARRRFEREIRVQSKIQHPNCLRMYEAGHTDNGIPYLVAEFFDGDALNDVIEENGTLDADTAIRIGAQVALAMEAAHDIGIVHRDLSPDHILLQMNGHEVDLSENLHVKVLDFGLAGVMDKSADEDTSLTAVGVRVGTPFYMAPEYIEDFECDHRADLYALGIVLFEILTGAPPFEGRPYKVMDMHVNKEPPKLSDVANVPPWLSDLVGKLLSKNPDDRPPSARAVIAAMEKGAKVEFYTEDTDPGVPDQDTSEVTMIGTGVARDPVLQQFKQALVVQVDRRTGDRPPGRDSLVAERVSKYSVAADYGIEPGMHLHIEELDEGILDPTDLLKAHDTLTYVFHNGSERVRLKTRGALLGVNLQRSVENVRTYYNPATDPPECLLELWNQGAWEVLERLCLRTMKGSIGGLSGGLFARFIGGGKAKPINHPATLLYGAALIEQGRGDEGFPYVREFKQQYAMQWPEPYQAIAIAYQGVQRLQSGRRDMGIELLLESYKLYPMPKIRRALEKTAGKAPDQRSLYQQQFPPYELLQTNGYPGANLEATLSQMDDSQVLLIVLMGGFRGNEAYNAFMMRYMNYARHFTEFVAGVHVCTTVKDRTSDHKAEWFAGEDMAVAAGLPVLILEDYRAFVQREAKPIRIPTVYAVNRNGVVLHEGLCESADFWNAIGRAGQLRMNRLHSS